MILENFKNGYEVSNGSLLAKSEKNDCLVRAFANALNVTYDVAHKFTAEKFERKFRKGAKMTIDKLSKLGKVSFELFKDSLFPVTKEYNLKFVHNPINKEYTHKKVSYTVKTFSAMFNKGTYVVLVHKHALVIKDGIVVDNPNNRFEGYRRVVMGYIKVS